MFRRAVKYWAVAIASQRSREFSRYKFSFVMHGDARHFCIEFVCLCPWQGCGRHTQCVLASSRRSILGAAGSRARPIGVRDSYVMQLTVLPN